MKKLSIALASVLFVALATVAAVSVQPVSAVCTPGSDSTLDRIRGPEVMGDRFEAQLVCGWLHASTPFLGVVKKDGIRSYGVDNVTYTPAYFFPGSCRGGLTIQVSGEKSPAFVHILTTEVNLGSGPADASQARETMTIR